MRLRLKWLPIPYNGHHGGTHVEHEHQAIAVADVDQLCGGCHLVSAHGGENTEVITGGADRGYTLLREKGLKRRHCSINLVFHFRTDGEL